PPNLQNTRSRKIDRCNNPPPPFHHLRLIRIGQQAQQPAHRLAQRVKPRLVRVRSSLTESRDRAIYQTRIERPQSLITQPQAFCRAGTEIFHEHVRTFQQLDTDLFTLGGFEIQSQTFFVPIQMREVETEERVRCEIAIRITVRRRLDLDHARAKIG